MSENSPLVVETTEGYTTGILTKLKEYVIPMGLVIVLFAILVYCSYKESFASPDGVVARKGKHQKRSDPEVDKEWNRQELEKAVAAINSSA